MISNYGWEIGDGATHGNDARRGDGSSNGDEAFGIGASAREWRKARRWVLRTESE